MSGIKFSDIMISRSHYDSLLNDSNELHTLRNSLPGMQQDILRQCSTMVDNIVSNMGSRLRGMDNKIQSLGTEMARYEQAVQQELSRQQQNFRNGLKDLSKNMSHMGEKISRQFAEMQKNMQDSFQLTNARITQLQADTAQQINDISNRVTALEEKEKYAEALTRQMLDYTAIQYESIEKIPMHERFAPGKLDQIRPILSSIEDDYSHGVYQAALPRARDTVDRLTELRVEVEKAYREWEQFRIAAVTIARELLARIESNKEIQAVDIDGRELPGVELDTDYWSEGKLGVLSENISKDLAILEKNNCAWNTEKLQRWLETTADNYQEELLAALLSQFRTDMGDTLCEALKAQGYELAGGASEPLFEDLDPRKPLLADFESVDGAHVAFKITPDVENFKNSFEIHSFDANVVPESQLRARQRDINEMLHQELELNVTPTHEEAQADKAVLQSFSTACRKASISI